MVAEAFSPGGSASPCQAGCQTSAKKKIEEATSSAGGKMMERLLFAPQVRAKKSESPWRGNEKKKGKESENTARWKGLRFTQNVGGAFRNISPQ